MNEEQVKSSLRTLLSTFGGMIAGWFAAKGWFTIDQVTSVLNSPTFISLAGSLIVGIWGLFVHKQSNAVAVVGAIAADPKSPVRGVVTANTIEGRELAQSIPGPTVAAAGTDEAKKIVTPGATL